MWRTITGSGSPSNTKNCRPRGFRVFQWGSTFDKAATGKRESVNLILFKHILLSTVMKLGYLLSGIGLGSKIPSCAQCIHFKNAQDVRLGKCGMFPKDAYGDPCIQDPVDYTFCFIAWKNCQGKYYRDKR